MKKNITLILLFCSLLFSCKKESVNNTQTTPVNTDTTTATPTQLKTQVIDTTGNPVADATATLYNSKSDLINKTNPVASTTTDPMGYMYFSSATSNITTAAYYFYIKRDCIDNYNTSINYSSPLIANTLNLGKPIVLTGVGQIQLTSNSKNPYKVLYDGNTAFESFTGGTTHSMLEIPIGVHVIRVLQLSGYLLTPTDETFIQNVYCGTTTEIVFP